MLHSKWLKERMDEQIVEQKKHGLTHPHTHKKHKTIIIYETKESYARKKAMEKARIETRHYKFSKRNVDKQHHVQK